MIIIALVLFANIFVVRVYFKEGTPPDCIEKLCDFLSTKKRKSVKRVHVSQPNGAQGIVKSTATMAGIEMTESNRESPSLFEREDHPQELEFTWRRVARKMDHVFFVIFIIASCIAYAVTFT